MAGAVSFFATRDDEDLLLDYLEEGSGRRLFSWWTGSEDGFIGREEARSYSDVGVWAPELGELRWISPSDPEFSSSVKTEPFHRINWSQSPGRKLLDVDSAPALLWRRGSIEPPILTPSSIGHQAASLNQTPDGFRPWFNRVSSWVRRRGHPVWDCSDPTAPKPLGDVQLSTVSTVYALPSAYAKIRDGSTSGRD